MGVLALILGILGGLCAVMGVITALEVAPTFVNGEELIGPIVATTAFWLGLAVILLLGCIAAAVSRSPYE